MVLVLCLEQNRVGRSENNFRGEIFLQLTSVSNGHDCDQLALP